MYHAISTALRTILTLALLHGAAVALAADGNTQQNSGATGGGQDAQQSDDTIVSALQSREDYGRTVEALERAGLSETLAGQGPFTVFAPTDEAWQQLDEAARDRLMSTEGLSDLRDVLSYHVVPDEIRASDVGQMGSITTIQGQPLEISRAGEQITVNQATVVEPGLTAGNGVVHGIDQVLMPRQ